MDTTKTYTVTVATRHRHGDTVYVVNMTGRDRDEAVDRAERFCGGVAVEAHDQNPQSGGGRKRG